MNASEMRAELSKIKGLGGVTINRIVEHFEKREFVEPNNQYCYSWDGEYYNNGLFESEQAAIDDARDSDPDAEEVYIGMAVKPKLRWFSNEEQILESMQANLYEDCGECASDGLEITTEQEVELGNMIDKVVQEWIDKNNIKPTCYSVIEYGLHVLKED